MTPEQREKLEYQISVQQAELDGKRIELKHKFNKKWENKSDDEPYNWLEYDYRVAQTKTIVHDWSLLHPDVTAVATNKDGSVYLLIGAPAPAANDYWYASKLSIEHDLTAYTFIEPATCDWKDSLVYRPEGE